MHLNTLSPDAFPPMRGQPAYATVLACLDRLSTPSSDTSSSPSRPPVWDCTTPRCRIAGAAAVATLQAQRATAAVVRYLGAVLASDLAWLADDDQREAVWAAASRCLADRCGRTATGGTLVRRWPLGDALSSSPSSVSLVLAEPALVGDALGFKTWGTSYAVACQLPALVRASPALRPLRLDADDDSNSNTKRDSKRILELGAGTGLLGLAAAVLWPGADVLLTDLPTIVPNLAANVARNADAVAAAGSRAQTAVLVWGADAAEGDSDNAADAAATWPLVLAADVLYDDDHPALLAHAIDGHLVAGPASRALVAVPLRDRHAPVLAAAFVAAMARRGLPVMDAGQLAGTDSDWGEGGDDDDDDDQGDETEDHGRTRPGRFTCSWWVFGRRATDGAASGEEKTTSEVDKENRHRTEKEQK